MTELIFREIMLSPNAIHNLWSLVLGVLQRTKPVGEGMRLFSKTKAIERCESKRGIAQPGITIIPVALLADRLWKRGGGCGHKRACGSVGHHFEREYTTMDSFPILAILGTLREPSAPAVER